MWPEQQPRGEARPHAYDLFDEGTQIGTLHWRARPRRAVGWYLTRSGKGPEPLFVDTAIRGFSPTSARRRTIGTCTPSWRAILSTALALDAAGRELHPERAQGTRRFRRGLAAGRYEIHVTDVEPAILSRITPRLHLDSVSNVTILAGELLDGGLEVAIQRIGLVGGRIVAVFRSDEVDDEG